MSQSLTAEKKEKLIQEILFYLVKHPGAKDTIDGVMQWWLSKKEVSYEREEVLQALHWLVAQGWIHERSPSQALYWVKQERLREIRAFVKIR